MKPSTRPASTPAPTPSRPSLPKPTPPPLTPARQNAPIPASELVKKPPASRPSTPSPAAPAPAGPRLLLTVLAGATKGQRYRLPPSGAVIGRTRGAILLPDDPFISPQHATVVLRDGKLFVRDESSTSGVFVTISAQETIPVGGQFAVGQRLFRFAGPIDPAPPVAKVTPYGAPVPLSQVHYCIEEVLVGGRAGRALVTASSIVTIGQSRCDLSFPGDEGMAGRHCELSPMPNGAMVRDLSGGLGTFVKLPSGSERQIKPGDRLRIGQSVLQVDLA